MSGYIGTQPVPQATQTRDAFTATNNQTSFPTSGYTPEFLDVFLNGVKLAASDYTATNGSDVVLAVGATTGDILEVVSYSTFEVLNPTFDGNVTFTGNASFGDNDKAIFGAELEIYSDATHARIREYGSGQLKIQGDNMQLLTSNGASTYIEGNASTSAVTLYHASNSPRLATTATGIDVTGTAVMDGLTVNGASARVQVSDTGTSFTAQDFLSNSSAVRATIGVERSSGGGLFVGSSAYAAVFGTASNGATQFATNNNIRMTIDSSGNLLVGTTTYNGPVNASSGDYGAAIWEGGLITAGTNASETLALNRMGSDGDIAMFKRSGSTVGSIGVVNANNMYLAGSASNHAGVQFGTQNVTPYNNGSQSDGAVDLGAYNLRWKDTYLSGGIYLGGTGSANKLEDYEHGTWTPSFEGDTTAGTYTYVERQGHYVRIGNQVTAWVNLTNISTGSAGSGRIAITGLPYSANWMTGFNGESVGVIGLHGFVGINGSFIMPIIQDGLNKIFLYSFQGSNNTSSVINVTDKVDNGSDIRGFVTYYIGG